MLRFLLRRARRLLMGEVLAEIAALRREIAENDAKVEAALLTIALSNHAVIASEAKQSISGMQTD